jgi:hypothetical protein
MLVGMKLLEEYWVRSVTRRSTIKIKAIAVMIDQQETLIRFARTLGYH